MPALDNPRVAQMEAIRCLDLLGQHLLMWGKVRTEPPADPPLDLLMGIARCMFTYPDNAPLVASGGLLLEYYTPGWRDALGDALGPITQRDDTAVARWRKEVLARDGCCQMCSAAENLHVHHIIPWSSAPELRLVTDNGLTLCAACHRNEHRGSVSNVSRYAGARA